MSYRPLTFLLSILLLCLSTSCLAREPDWGLYNQVLKTHVHQGHDQGISSHLVDYKGLAQDERFKQVVNSLETFDPQLLSTTKEKLSFYINAYNILTLNLVIQNAPVESIKDIGHLFSPVWDKKAGKIGGTALSLNDIEHQILRKMDEARIHFAIVCASLSCPNLRHEAYTASKLDEQLDEQVKDFLNNPTKGLVVKNGEMRVSKIFRWFEKDFKTYGGVVNFVRRFHPLPKDISFDGHLPYNWSLNRALKPTRGQAR